MAELSERPTPRKLSAPQSPSTAKTSALKQAPNAGKSPRKLAIRAGTEGEHPVQLSLDVRPLLNGEARKLDPGTGVVKKKKVTLQPPQPTSIPRANGAVEQQPSHLSRAPKFQHSIMKPPRGVSDTARSVDRSSQTSTHVNGIVSHLNSVNGAESRASSIADKIEESDKRPPPSKLKRKAPG